MKSVMEEKFDQYRDIDDVVINGLQFYKIIHSDKLSFLKHKDYRFTIIPSPNMTLFPNCIYVDEADREFVLMGPCHVKFNNEIPQWYLKAGLWLLSSKENTIGNYLRKKDF